MAAHTVIELDVGPAAGPAPEPGLPPGWWRAFTVACLAVACAAGLVAGDPLATPRLKLVATLDTPPMLSERVSGDMMFSIVSGRSSTLQAYRLSDGSLRWSIPLPVPDSAASVDVAGPVERRPGPAPQASPAATVLVSSLDPSLKSDRTAAVDAATGRVLWRSPSYRASQINAGSVALLFDSNMTDDGLSRRYHQVDVRTGRELWGYQVPGGWTTVLPDEPRGADTERHLVAVSPTGAARSVELATGREVAATAIDLGVPDPADTEAAGAEALVVPNIVRQEAAATAGPSLMVRDDVLLVGHVVDGRSVLTGYRVDRLTPLWTVTLRSPSTLRVDGCGSLLCLAEGSDVRALRPDTGAVVWTGTGLAGALGLVGRWLYMVTDLVAAYGYWTGPARLIDTGTGHTDLDLGSWRLLSQADQDGPALFELVDPDSGQVWLGELGDGPHVQPLGAVTDLPSGSCDASTAYIVCETSGDQVRIWRYRA
jgi:outer membrane protein assembly factor BamB